MAKKKEAAAEITIDSIDTVHMSVWLVGTSPLLLNRLAEKARHELLMPSPPKNRAARQANLKHDPYAEYRSSVYRQLDAKMPTRLVFPGGGLRKAIASAALDIPGVHKAQIVRLVRVREYNLSIYGAPRLSCMIVRQAGINKTPDVRTRAIVPEWCCQATISFATPLLSQKAILNLIQAAGEFIGIGDGRNEKGSSLSFGSFQLADLSNPKDKKLIDRIIAAGSMAQQDTALESPVPYDHETAELLSWFDGELVRRGSQITASYESEEETEEDEDVAA